MRGIPEQLDPWRSTRSTGEARCRGVWSDQGLIRDRRPMSSSSPGEKHEANRGNAASRQTSHVSDAAVHATAMALTGCQRELIGQGS